MLPSNVAQCPPSYNPQQQQHFDVNATYGLSLLASLLSSRSLRSMQKTLSITICFLGLTRITRAATLPSPRFRNEILFRIPSLLPFLWFLARHGQKAAVGFIPHRISVHLIHSMAALSLSPQPNLHEYYNALNFNYTPSMPQQFAASSSTWQTLPVNTPSSRSSMSHSPSASCSSLDGVEIKTSPSRDGSPMRAAPEVVDPQASRRRFPCIIIGCERRFTSQYTLKVHMEAHKPKPRSSFPCTLGCAERFSRQHDRLRHEVAKHGKVCEFLCDDCGRFFSTKKTLGNHKCPVAQGGTRWVNQ
jgi:hypothetical protein